MVVFLISNSILRRAKHGCQSVENWDYRLHGDLWYNSFMENLTDTHSQSSESVDNEGIETTLEGQPQGGALKRKKFPTYHGFDGRFRKIGELRDRLPAFRDFYIERRFIAGEKLSAIKIVDMFNAMTPPGDFFPHATMFARWRKRWESEQSGLVKTAEARIEERESRAVVPVSVGVVPAMEQLEEGMMTLGAELANDAMQTLRDTQEREELFDDEVVVKRKQYVLNVFAYVTKAAHSKQALDLKRHGEARETAGFMLDILRRATAGKLSAEDLAMLRGSATREHANPIPASAQ